MASGLPNFGIWVQRVDEEALPVIAADLSTVGIIGPAPLANTTIFPLNDPVHVDSTDIDMLAYLGTSGYVVDALRGVNDQLGVGQFSARTVIVRTAEGVSSDPQVKLGQTIANICGDSTQGTGIWAFLKSPAKLGMTPRLIMAPGYTGQMANSIDRVTRLTAGSGYIEGDDYTLTFSGGGDDAVQAVAHARGQPDGTLGAAIMDTYGAWYDSGATPTVTAAAYAGAKATGFFLPTVNPTNGKVLTIDDAPITFVTDSATGDQVNIGLTLADTMVALQALAAGSVTSALAENNYALGTGADAAKLTITKKIIGAAGNATTLTTDVVGATVSGETLLGGADAGVAATYSATTALGANPVCAALTPVLNGLVGHAVVESSGTSLQNDTDWRETIQSERIIALSGGVKILDSEGDVVVRPFAPRVIGIGVRRDYEKGAPFHSWANQPVMGIVGPARDIAFSITDSANEGQTLLGFNIGFLARGEIGSDFAIANSGFVFVGTDNCAENELWRFYNITRGRDYINLGLIRTLRYYLGRFNIVGATVHMIVETMIGFLRDLKARDHILGYNVSFTGQYNSAEEIRLGHLTVGFKAEEPPPLKLLTIRSARYRAAIDALVKDLAAQLNLSA